MLVRSFVLCFFIATLITAGSAGRCCLPSTPGFCKAYFPRFFYNTTAQRCEPFIYGGCLGNRNNFATRQECSEVCRDVEC